MSNILIGIAGDLFILDQTISAQDGFYRVVDTEVDFTPATGVLSYEKVAEGVYFAGESLERLEALRPEFEQYYRFLKREKLINERKGRIDKLENRLEELRGDIHSFDEYEEFHDIQDILKKEYMILRGMYL